MRKNQQPIPSEVIETNWRIKGYSVIAGVDEVGRGAWAGPLVVGAVILPSNHRIQNLRDSKFLSPTDREMLSRRIKKIAIAWAVGIVDVPELNQIGLGRALGVAAQRALEKLKPIPQIALVDGKYPFQEVEFRQETVIKGDQKVRCIAAASIVAKVERDRMMRRLHQKYKNLQKFQFDLNKGYPSPNHITQLSLNGPSFTHRLNFAPVRESMTQRLFGLDEN